MLLVKININIFNIKNNINASYLSNPNSKNRGNS